MKKNNPNFSAIEFFYDHSFNDYKYSYTPLFDIFDTIEFDNNGEEFPESIICEGMVLKQLAVELLKTSEFRNLTLDNFMSLNTPFSNWKIIQYTKYGCFGPPTARHTPEIISKNAKIHSIRLKMTHYTIYGAQTVTRILPSEAFITASF